MPTPPQAPPNARREPASTRPEVRQRAVLAVLSHATLTAAAQACHVDASTLRRWLREDPEFKAELAAASHAAFDEGIARIHALTTKAVAALDELLDAKRHPAVRLGAARSVLELASARHDAATLLARLDELERHQERLDAAGKGR